MKVHQAQRVKRKPGGVCTQQRTRVEITTLIQFLNYPEDMPFAGLWLSRI
jgi:hypothetical protein